MYSDSLVASVYPSTGVYVGDSINLTCTLNYNAPPINVTSPFPLSDNQDPGLKLFIGQTDMATDLLGDLVIGTDTLPESKSIVSNNISESELHLVIDRLFV